MSRPLLSRSMKYLRVSLLMLLAVGIVLVALPQSDVSEGVVGNGLAHVRSTFPATEVPDGSSSGMQSDDDEQSVWKVWSVDSRRESTTGNEPQNVDLDTHRRMANRRLEADDEQALSVSDSQATSTGDDSEPLVLEKHPESSSSKDHSETLTEKEHPESTSSEDKSKSFSLEEHLESLFSKDKGKTLAVEEHSETISAGDQPESKSSGDSKSSSEEESVSKESSTVSASPPPPPPGTPPPPPPPHVPPPSKKKNWKDIKVEEYIPLVESVHSNIVSRKFQFVIKILAMNNYASLHRCLYSLQEAEYAGDDVDVHIYIDHFELSSASERRRLLSEDTGSKKVETISNSKADRINRMKERSRLKNGFNRGRMLEAEAGEEDKEDTEEMPTRLPDRLASGVEIAKASNWSSVEERLAEARRVLNYAESFYWKHGKKVIHYRTRRAGSQSQWLDAWWPSSDDEFALFLEDDAEVSPLFYRYARSLIATYHYNGSYYDRLLYGISLQRPQIVPGRGGRPIKVDDRTRLFKYQMVGIWGQIFFPRPWKEFRQWYDAKKSHNVKPVVDGLLTTDWYDQHGENLFTPWFVKFVHSRGYFNMYTNFLRDRVLSVTHRDTGVKTKKYSGCDSVLIWENGTYDIDIWHMAASWNIKKYDFCFREVNAGRFANDSSALDWVLWSASGGTKELLVLSIFGVPDVLVKNWLCALRKLGIENYLVVGDDPVLLEYLARRGHAAMRFENEQTFVGNIEKEMGAVSVILGKGYSLWFARADTIWLGNPTALVKTDEVDVMGLENSRTSLFFVRSISEITKLWDVLVEGLSTEEAVNETTWDTWEKARLEFVKECKGNDAIRTKKLEQVTFLDDEESIKVHVKDGEGLAHGKVVGLPKLKSMRSYEIKEKLKPLDLWNLDGDWACATVVC